MSNPLMGSVPTTVPTAPGMNTQALQSVRRMVGMYRATKNPRAALQNLAQQNPGIAQIMQMAGPGGLQGMFHRLCQEQGVDPNAVLQQIL